MTVPLVATSTNLLVEAKMTVGEAVNQLMSMPIRSDVFFRFPDGSVIPVRGMRLENGYGLPFIQGTDPEAVIMLQGEEPDGSR